MDLASFLVPADYNYVLFASLLAILSFLYPWQSKGFWNLLKTFRTNFVAHFKAIQNRAKVTTSESNLWSH